MQRTSPAATPLAAPSMRIPPEIIIEIIEYIARPHLQQLELQNTNPPSQNTSVTTPPTITSTATINTTQTQAQAQAVSLALQTLLNLTLTSQPLQTLTLPILYRHFALGYNDPSGINLPPHGGQRLVSFTRTLLLNPALAALVKRAFFHPKLVSQMGSENMIMISAIAKRRLKKLHGGESVVFDDQPIETLMYALMPNLERLVFAGRRYVLVPGKVREVAWKGLKGVEQAEEYGWSFSEMEGLRRYEEELGINMALPDEDDDL
ncbi:hypothetical protein B0T14DRAFT_514167 [Immersiella caudata]|uniref:Uncharacterized protein n=1 Tax=Immersiella caudata TaxID=314043 RepID=A0AA40C2I1_9PEZI|nr:hypothetical protein B0T14DRAFT_514167 [Immersiella caudata]